ncbi:phosphoribosyltransferase domain-containing protein [Nakamurella leprariae]|uniref:Phosphoribosyltransferase domain-containing protein n=1 Tax=Nakamurella leprariae TaxID=2803911 RepID=A0A938YH00_9ACTN|nr:phosphoribosyltransferase domain-containing protein [Nakamurella leprariae]MBM9467939.1 phosphoribosyltransferase domain-containing protein [Nakamurella leprariae]
MSELRGMTIAPAPSWVADRFGVRVRAVPPAGEPTEPAQRTLDGLIRLALRRNPKRAQLLVSTVLGKHLPTDPRVVIEAGSQLGRAVADRLDDAPAGERVPAPVVLGFAETATSLGHLVADALDAPVYLHSTRRRTGVPVVAGFEEVHSHATGHLLCPDPAEPFVGLGEAPDPTPLVLVDDELSTGATAMALIRELHRLRPRTRYVLAGLVDLRGPADRDRLTALAAELGCRIDVVALARGTVELPRGLVDVVAAELGAAGSPSVAPAPAPAPAKVTRVAVPWPAGLPQGGRHGFTAAHRAVADEAVTAAAAALRAVLPTELPGSPHTVVVLGSEELMYVPLRLAQRLASDGEPGLRVLYQSTTRSPVHAVDRPGYPIRRSIPLPAFDPADEVPRYVHNAGAGWDAGPADERIAEADVVVLVVDAIDGAGRADQAAAAIAGATGAPVVLAVLQAERLERGATR